MLFFSCCFVAALGESNECERDWFAYGWGVMGGRFIGSLVHRDFRFFRFRFYSLFMPFYVELYACKSVCVCLPFSILPFFPVVFSFTVISIAGVRSFSFFFLFCWPRSTNPQHKEHSLFPVNTNMPPQRFLMLMKSLIKFKAFLVMSFFYRMKCL